MRTAASCMTPWRLALIAICLPLLAGCFATSPPKVRIDPLPPELAAPPRKPIPLQEVERELQRIQRLKEANPSHVGLSPSGRS